MRVSTNWQIMPKNLFAMGPIIPVLVIHKVEDALPIAEALLAADVKVLEVTLRTPAALDAISLIAKELPEAIIGSGTVTNRHQLQQSVDAGAKFALSPGLTKNLLQAGCEGSIALIPGISSVSELNTNSFTEFKIGASLYTIESVNWSLGCFPSTLARTGSTFSLIPSALNLSKCSRCFKAWHLTSVSSSSTISKYSSSKYSSHSACFPSSLEKIASRFSPIDLLTSQLKSLHIELILGTTFFSNSSISTFLAKAAKRKTEAQRLANGWYRSLNVETSSSASSWIGPSKVSLSSSFS